MTRVMIWRGSQNLTQVEVKTEQIDMILSGRTILKIGDVTITEMYAETMLRKFNFYPDSRVPHSMIKELGFKPNNQGRH